MTTRPDVLTLIIGLVLTGFAAAALILTILGGLAWSIAQVAAPLTLIAIGVIGIVFSQRRDRPADPKE